MVLAVGRELVESPSDLGACSPYRVGIELTRYRVKAFAYAVARIAATCGSPLVTVNVRMLVSLCGETPTLPSSSPGEMFLRPDKATALRATVGTCANAAWVFAS